MLVYAYKRGRGSKNDGTGDINKKNIKNEHRIQIKLDKQHNGNGNGNGNGITIIIIIRVDLVGCM